MPSCDRCPHQWPPHRWRHGVRNCSRGSRCRSCGPKGVVPGSRDGRNRAWMMWIRWPCEPWKHQKKNMISRNASRNISLNIPFTSHYVYIYVCVYVYPISIINIPSKHHYVFIYIVYVYIYILCIYILYIYIYIYTPLNHHLDCWPISDQGQHLHLPRPKSAGSMLPHQQVTSGEIPYVLVICHTMLVRWY